MEFVLCLLLVASSMLIGGTLGEIKGFIEGKAGIENPKATLEINNKKIEIELTINKSADESWKR